MRKFILIPLIIIFFAEQDIAHPVLSLRSINSSKINLLRSQDINFGGVITGLTPGTITVNPDGRVDYNGGIMRNYHAGISPPHPAQLTVTLYNAAHCHDVDHSTSDDNESTRLENDDTRTNDDRLDFTRHGLNVQISLPNVSTLQSASNPSVSMMADHFTVVRTSGTLMIGATLHVGAMQVPGLYAGSFPVTMICE